MSDPGDDPGDDPDNVARRLQMLRLTNRGLNVVVDNSFDDLRAELAQARAQVAELRRRESNDSVRFAGSPWYYLISMEFSIARQFVGHTLNMFDTHGSSLHLETRPELFVIERRTTPAYQYFWVLEALENDTEFQIYIRRRGGYDEIRCETEMPETLHNGDSILIYNATTGLWVNDENTPNTMFPVTFSAYGAEPLGAAYAMRAQEAANSDDTL